MSRGSRRTGSVRKNKESGAQAKFIQKEIQFTVPVQNKRSSDEVFSVMRDYQRVGVSATIVVIEATMMPSLIRRSRGDRWQD
jgi:hypothetical protein